MLFFLYLKYNLCLRSFLCNEPCGGPGSWQFTDLLFLAAVSLCFLKWLWLNTALEAFLFHSRQMRPVDSLNLSFKSNLRNMQTPLSVRGCVCVCFSQPFALSPFFTEAHSLDAHFLLQSVSFFYWHVSSGWHYQRGPGREKERVAE